MDQSKLSTMINSKAMLAIYWVLALLPLNTSAQGTLSPKAVKHQALPQEVPLLDAATTDSEPKLSPIQEDLIRAGSAGNFIAIGTAYNIFTILTEGQNQVSWNEALESVIFVHRHNAGTPGGSGGLSFDRSTDGGESWTTNTGISPGYNAGSISGNLGNRYPSGLLFNPSGNTNPDNAYVAAVGPALDGSSPDDSWGLVFRNSSRADGSAVSEFYGGDPGDSDYFPYGLSQTSDGSLWYILGVRNGTGSVSADSLNGSKFKLWKGTFNSSSSDFDWTLAATLRPDYFTYLEGGFLNRYNTFTYNLAFSPDGQTGYAVIIGGPAGGATTGLSPKPIVFKSTDAGSSWNPLPDFDFATLPAMADFLTGANQGEGPILPYFLNLDAAVDQDGSLHLFSEVNSRFTASTDPDSLYFIYLANVRPVSCLYHLITSNGSDWTASVVDTVRTEDGALPNPGTTDLSVGTNGQISRNADGSKIFFTWAASDINILTFNDLPNLLGRGYDVESLEYTFISNFTEGTGFDGVAFFPTMAPTVVETGSDFDYEMPVVFAIPGTDAASTAQFVYSNGIGFNEVDFGALAPAPTAGFTWSYIGYGGSVNFTNTSVNASSYIWDFGDGLPLSSLVNPAHLFPESGVFNVCLTANNGGVPNTFCQDVDVVNVGLADASLAKSLQVGPNPASDRIQVRLDGNTEVTVEVLDVFGRRVLPLQNFRSQTELDLSALPTGTYQVLVREGARFATQRLSVVR